MVVLPTRGERAPEQVDGTGLPAAQPGTERTATFLAKLRPTVSPAYLLPRPRLHRLVEDCLAAPLTLVVAPAGSGKTSLLRSWAGETSIPHAWLSLDEDDRDPVQLWRGLLAALEGLAPGCGLAVTDRFRRPGALLEAVRELLDDLEGRQYPGKVLVIDDLQLVDEEEAVASSLAVFVQHLPPWLHVVVASRRAPRLPVHRLRTRGQLGEVHFAELRFTEAESTAMLTRLAPALEPEVVADVAERAGGWAASIQLAALAARSSQAQGHRYLPNHDDDDVYLADYVWREILANEDDELVDVLLATAVVKQVDADLARTLASRPDAADLLALAEERGLFVSRIEPSGFELHSLVRDVLVGALAKRAPDRLANLNARAAEWLEAHGRTVTALEHWLRAERPRDALRLLATQAQALYDGGHESTILRTVRALPASVATEDPGAMIEYAWSNLLVDRWRFVGLVDDLTRSVDETDDLAPAQRARIDVLGSIAATLRGSWSEGAALARSALLTLGETWWLDPIGQFAWNMIARDIALSERWDDGSQEARDVVRALGVSPERRLAFEGTRALAEALAGRPVDALRVAAGARHSSDVASMSLMRSEIRTGEAMARRELGDAATAIPMLQELGDARIEPGSHSQLLARLELAHAWIDEGDLEAASAVFDAAAELVGTEMPGPGARVWLARTGTVLALAAGDPEEAQGWADRVADGFWSPVSTARVRLAVHDLGSAAAALKLAEPRSPRQHVLAGLLQFRASTLPAEAERHLLGAVRLASAQGMVQTVASEGRDVVEAIEKLAWSAPPGWLDRLRRAGRFPTTGSPTARVDPPTERLTGRELEVLRMLPSRLTQREIADELFISINTLKFHLKVIYRKLGCGSRAEAAEVARTLTSLHRPTQPSSTRRRWTS